MAEVYIGLGTNIGHREENLSHAREKLRGLEDIEISARSSIMETEPVDYDDQPRFLNQVIKVRTSLEPEKLLEELKSIEKEMGRKVTHSKGPRIIDLDILLYDDRIIKSDLLTIPHREILNRRFVIEHLAELDPELVDPATSLKYREVLEK